MVKKKISKFKLKDILKKFVIYLNNFFELYGPWIFGILFGIFTIFLLLILFNQTKILTSLLGFNPGWIFYQIFGLGYFFIIIFASRKFLLEALPKKSIFNRILIKFNIYVLLSFFIIIFILIVGIGYISFSFQQPLPINIEIFHYNSTYYLSIINQSVVNITKFYCWSNYDNFIVGQLVYCNFNITYRKNSPFHLSRVEVSRRNLSDIYNMISYQEFTSDKNFSQYYLYIPLELEAKQNYLVTLNFKNMNENVEQTINQVYYRYWTIESISFKDYNEKFIRKNIYILGIISLIFFSIFSAIKNLRDLMEPKTR